MSKVKPIITGINKPIKVRLGKRLDDVDENIHVTCPDCGYKMRYLDDPADLEYGSFYISDECWECGKEFEDTSFKVKAYIIIEEVD